MFEIDNLHVQLEDESKEILKGISLSIGPARFTQLWVLMAQENLQCLMFWRVNQAML